MAEQRTTHILVVEDDEGTRLLLQSNLRSLGYDVSVAVDGPSALEALQSRRPDGILLDIGMPGMDGLEVCRRLRAAPGSRELPILLVTAHEDLATRLAGFEAGADDYILKPFDRQELAARLRAHVRLAEMRGRVAQLRGVLATIRTVSHEFNNPLQAVVCGVELMQLALEDPGIDAAEARQIVVTETNRLAELARQLVSITEPEFRDTPIGTMLDLDRSR